MTSETWKLDPEALLRHEGWLRSLVRGLLGDGQQVDDVLQQTWLAALRRPPSEGSAMRSWLSRVARNFALRSHRDAARRRGHEGAAARPESLPSTEETVQKLAAQRFVTRCVSELAEPYRTAVLLRYHDELSTREIAERTGASEANVRQRIKRGMDEVRAKCEQEYGSDWRACSALLALAAPGRTAATAAVSTSILGVLLMSKGLGLAAAVALLVGLGVWLPSTLSEASEPGPANVEASAARAPDDDMDLASDPPVREDVVVSSGLQPIDDLAPSLVVEGRVLDAQARPLAGVSVGAYATPPTYSPAREPVPESEPVGIEVAVDTGVEPRAKPVFRELVRTDATGRFTLQDPPTNIDLIAGAGYCTHRSAVVLAGRPVPSELLIVATRSTKARGVVVDPDGIAIAGAEVRADVPDLDDFPLPLDATSTRYPLWVRCDSAGRFDYPAVPLEPGELIATADGYEPIRVRLDPRAALDVRIVMRPTTRARTALVVTGTVLDPHGVVIENATIRFGGARTRSNASGRFRLEFDAWEGWHNGTALVASSNGLQAWGKPEFGAELSKRKKIEIEIRFAARVRTIAGRVVRADGEPWPGLAVYPWDLAAFGPMNETLEDLSVDEGYRGVPSGIGARASVETGENGEFEVPGLRDQEYRLRVYDRRTGLAWIADPILAGTRDALIRAPSDAFARRLHGRLVSIDGTPLAGIRVDRSVMIEKTGSGSTSTGIPLCLTDADGRIELENVARHGTTLQFQGDEIVPSSIAVADLVDHFEVVGHRRCPFRLELDEPRSCFFEVIDGNGEKMTIYTFNARGSSATPRMRIGKQGRTSVVTVGENAAAVVLLDGQKEITRAPVQLTPGSVMTIRL